MAPTILATAASSWAVLMGIAPALQIRRMLRAQSSREVSVAYFTVLLIGFLLWIAYGVARVRSPSTSRPAPWPCSPERLSSSWPSGSGTAPLGRRRQRTNAVTGNVGPVPRAAMSHAASGRTVEPGTEEDF